MALISARAVARHLKKARDSATTTEQGNALEDLVCYLFGKIPGIVITHRNQLNTYSSEEIDVALWNNRRPGVLEFLPDVILIEAKNWSRPVGSAEVAWFDRKLANRGLDFGLLVALRGITGQAQDRTNAHQIVAQSLSERRRIIVLSADDLATLRDTGSLILLIKQKLCELVVTGTALP